MPEFEEEEELLEEEEEGQASEMYEHHRIEADNGQNLLRVDKFLMSECFPHKNSGSCRCRKYSGKREGCQIEL